MSGFGRGGRGGGRGGAGGGLTREKLPFELDPNILDDRKKLQDLGKTIDGEFDDPGSDWDEIYPPYPGGITLPEKDDEDDPRGKWMQEHFEAMRKSTFWSGGPGTVEAIQNAENRKAAFNAFEDQPTHGRKTKRALADDEEYDDYDELFAGVPDPPSRKKHKYAAPWLLPKELWAHIGYHPEDGGDGQGGRKLALPGMFGSGKKKKKKTRFEMAVEELEAEEKKKEGGDGGEDEDEDEGGEKEDDDAASEGLKDDDFEEDEYDDNDDYNAEQYFDGGDEDVEEGGGAEDYDDGY